ncbi:hypothetical protein VD659_11415 [Herbiconiux sp. 11R-BC]|uniref:hypothetical protein n=1 Tax=Herbiconiux sp. 11R-BC TaxID=3111637 RepID=UPI003C0501D2
MNPRRRLLGGLLLLLATLSAALAGAAQPASAAHALGHGNGVLWDGDHASWIGSYRLDDGSSGYCIDVTKPQPTGSDVDYVDGLLSGLVPADDAARLAYLSRTWGDPADPFEAAAAQLATWTITGLAGHDQAYFARRANGHAGEVLDAANHMLRRADAAGGASRGATASVRLDLAGPGGSVTPELVVDYLAGPQTVPPGTHDAVVTLRGATFEDGSREASVPNGRSRGIRPDQAGATETVVAEVSYRDLPYGGRFRLGRNTGAAQSLLVTAPFGVDARAQASATAPNDLPFRPRVQTSTGSVIAEAGDPLADELTVEVHPESPTGGAWGVYAASDGSLRPIPVVVSSTLWGPFPRRPAEAAGPPADGPIVCTVETVIDEGPVRRTTPPCVLPAAGYYVWTDSIDPGRTPADRGGDRLLGWSSGFGVAAETTRVDAAPAIETMASVNHQTGPGCVSDRLGVTGLPAGGDPIEVESTLIGPLAERPAPGSVPEHPGGAPVAGSVTTTVPGDGEYESPCIAVSAPGFYYFVFTATPRPRTVSTAAASGAGTPATGTGRPTGSGGSGGSGGSAPTAGSGLGDPAAEPDDGLVAAFSDSRVHEFESIEVVTPPSASPPATPRPTSPLPPGVPAGPPPTPAVPALLALTGSSVGDGGPVSIAATTATIIAGLAGLGLALRSRRRP